MPRKLHIKNGPSYRPFALNNGIAVGSEFTEFEFEMNQAHPPGSSGRLRYRFIHLMHLKMIGLVKPSEGKVERDEDLFSFIGYHRGCNRHHAWIYVGTYNIRTRQGFCVEYTREEFPENITLARDLLEILLAPDIY